MRTPENTGTRFAANFSEPDAGSGRLRLREIPYPPVLGREEPDMTAVTPGRCEYAVLIADDDAAMRETLREVVAGAGFSTLLASSGEEALDVVGQFAVHLALFDMHMPGLTGLETLQLVRQTHAIMPAILVTADPSRSLMLEAQKASVYCILPKPVRKDLVLHSVARAIQRHYGAGTAGG